MYSKTYPVGHGVLSFSSIYQAVYSLGISDAVITLEPGDELVIVSDSSTAANEADFDAAVSMAVNGSFHSNMSDKIDEIQLKTSTLTGNGFSFVRPSDASTQGPVELSHEIRHQLRNLKDDIADGLVTLPQMINTLDGHGALIFTSTDADAVYQALLDRGVYLLGPQQNGDLSYGENGYIQQATQAANQAALDAIIDTRS